MMEANSTPSLFQGGYANAPALNLLFRTKGTSGNTSDTAAPTDLPAVGHLPSRSGCGALNITSLDGSIALTE